MLASLLEILKCPRCSDGTLRLEQAKETDGEIMSGLLGCDECGDRYPIEDGIPCLLPKDLREITPEVQEKWMQKYKEMEDSLRDADADTFRQSFKEFADGQEMDERELAFLWEYRLYREYEEHLGRNAPEKKMGFTLTLSSEILAKRNDRLLGLVKQKEGELRGKRALNNGSGYDTDLPDRLDREGVEAVHFDLVKESLLSLRRSDGKRHLVCGDARILPFRDGVFDFSLCIGIIHHIHPIDEPLSQASRVLAPGGGIYVVESNPNSLLTLPRRLLPDFLRRLLRKVFRMAVGQKQKVLKGSPFEKTLSKEAISEALERVEFQPRDIEVLQHSPPHLPSFLRHLWEKGAALAPSSFHSLAAVYTYSATKR